MLRKTLRSTSGRLAALCLAAAGALGVSADALAWTPEREIEIVVPAGPNGGADIMARRMAEIIRQHKLAPAGVVVVNKHLGAGAEAFLEMKSARRDPHRIMVSLSSVYTTPISQNLPFNWAELTPVQMMALDQFVLWVHADSPYRTTKDYVAALKAGAEFTMAGTGRKQEDEILTAAIRKATGGKIAYRGFQGGGPVANQVANKVVTSSVNNPIEAAEHWKAGRMRPLCVFDGKRLAQKAPVAGEASWSSIPTCVEEGLDVKYTMMRAFFMAPDVSSAQVDYYRQLFAKVAATEDWQAFLDSGAYTASTLSGDEFKRWLAKEEQSHLALMKGADMLAKRGAKAAKEAKAADKAAEPAKKPG